MIGKASLLHNEVEAVTENRSRKPKSEEEWYSNSKSLNYEELRRSTGMITEYIKHVMDKAHYEILADDASYYGEIPGFDGVYANASALEACRAELTEVLEEWILFRVSKNLSLPIVDGIELAIKELA